ncbi:MAG: glycosyltransferase [Actinomycetota bacterium]|nr:glycosyltransferase [Actinomycetota bacterium]
MAKFLIAGDWRSQIYEEPVAQSLERLGHSVVRFAWHGYFEAPGSPLTGAGSLVRRFQSKYMVGPRCERLNDDLVRCAVRERPDAILVYRGSHVTSRSLDRIRQAWPWAVLVGHNNDDPFSPRYPRWMWRHFRRALSRYDLVLAFRHQNIDDFQRSGARQVRLWRSWFIPELHHPVELTSEERVRYGCDVVFVGHYEPDHRLKYLDSIARRGLRLRLFGPDYPTGLGSEALDRLGPIRAVRGEEYTKALCGAKVALCFLSRLNRDTYTSRSFEIPATKTMMLSEYSDDLASLYLEGVEAAFFRTPAELVAKLASYLADDRRRESVAAGGYRRVWADGHDVLSRTKALVGWVSALREERQESPR